MGWELKKSSVLDEVRDRIQAASQRVLLAAPFISEPIGGIMTASLSDETERAANLDARLLSALTRSSVLTGYLSITALRAFRDAGFRLGSIPNLHAKVVVIDDWVLVGSGNLTRSGLDLANVELGLAGGAVEADKVATVFDSWWGHAEETGGTHNVDGWLAEHSGLGRSWLKFANEMLRDSKGAPLTPNERHPASAAARPGAPATPTASSRPSNRAQVLDRCIFTIQDSNKTAEEARLQGTFSLSEGRAWTQGIALFEEARDLGVELVLLLGPADGKRGTLASLTHRARIDGIELVPDPGSGRERTVCTYSGVQPINPPRALSELILNDGSRPMPDTDQRPYHICQTPTFI